VERDSLRPRRSRARVLAEALVVLVVLGGGLTWAWRGFRPRQVLDASGSGRGAGRSVGASVPARATDDTARIVVEVLNASGVRGLGRRATTVLRELGFDVVYTANAPEPLPGDSSLVLDRMGRPDAAARVAKALGGARVDARPDSSRYVHVTVLLGRAWRPPANALYP
jgi:hypothetical protein